MNYPHSLKTVWDISMARIEKKNPNSGRLLQILSLFDPDGIPESLLDGSDRQFEGKAAPIPEYLRKKLGYLNATKPLLQQSMIAKHKAQGTIYMHRLVGAITLRKIAPSDRQARFDEAVEFLYGVYPQLSEKKSSLNEDWAKCRLYVPQVFALEKYYRESESPLIPRAEFATVLANAAWFLFEQGLPSQSMQLLPSARAVGEATMTGNEFAVSMIYRCTGGIYLDINKAQAAFDNFYRQMRGMEDLGPDHELAVAAGLSNCALAEMSTGDYKESRDYLTRAQDIRSKYPGQAESYVALTLDVCGILDGMEGRYDDAIKNIKAAIELYDKELGVGNHFTALYVPLLANYDALLMLTVRIILSRMCTYTRVILTKLSDYTQWRCQNAVIFSVIPTELLLLFTKLPGISMSARTTEAQSMNLFARNTATS